MLAPIEKAVADTSTHISNRSIELVAQGALQALERKAQAYVDTLDPADYDISGLVVPGAFPDDEDDDAPALPR